MKRVLIIGAGDLGQQISHYISESNDFEVVGFVDDWGVIGEIRNGFQILGRINQLDTLYSQNIFDELLMGIGYNHFEIRKTIFEKYGQMISFATYIHPTCVIDGTAKIGKGVIILPKCVIDMEVVIDDNVFIYSGTVLGHNTHIGAQSMISLSVTTGGFSTIGKSCFLGIGTCICDKITIANHTFLGAGTNVIKDITEGNGVYVGNPARYLRENKS